MVQEKFPTEFPVFYEVAKMLLLVDFSFTFSAYPQSSKFQLEGGHQPINLKWVKRSSGTYFVKAQHNLPVL